MTVGGCYMFPAQDSYEGVLADHPDSRTWDVCPYNDELNDDQTECFCTPRKRAECAMDI